MRPGALRRAAGAALAAALLAAGPAPGEEAATPGTGDATAASADCVRRTAAAIQHRYENVSDLTAHFEQTTRSVSLGGPGAEQASRGTVTFAKPGRMRWHYLEPEESQVVSDGKTLWIYDPSLGEVQRLPMGDGYLSGAAVQFLLGEGDMLRDFEVSARSCTDESAELDLVPREPATYQRLRIVADPRSGDLSQTQVVDLLGNVTRVTFSELRANTHPPDSTFRFDPPEGVRVIDLTP